MTHRTPLPLPPRLAGHLLYARSRGLPRAAAALAAVALLALWAGDGPPWAPTGLVAAAAFGPLLASVAIAAGLHTRMPEAERSASRLRWPHRLAHLLGATAAAAALLGCAVALRGDGAAALAVIRDTVAAAGVTAAAATAVDARASWLPVAAYTCAVHLPHPAPRGETLPWIWPGQPGTEPVAWAAAGAVLVLGLALHARRGAAHGGR